MLSTRTHISAGAAPLIRRMSLGGNVPRLQAKLRIGPANDSYERVADSVADRVMRMPAPGVQRKCSECEKEEKKLQRKEGGAGSTPATAPPVVHDVVSGGGRPLDSSVRSFMEPRFGHDFGGVRIHTDGKAAESARSVNATAYTVGRNVVFGEGSYRPETDSGRRLIAHELTHVVQQGSGGTLLQRAPAKSPCSVHAYDASDPKDKAVVPSDKSGIPVTSVADMVTKVKAYVNDEKNACSCVARLEINGHGADGNQSVGAGLGNDADKILDADSTDDHLRQLTGIPFCNTGLFMLLGCHIGGTRGKKLLTRLATLLPGKLVGGSKNYTAGTGLGNKKVAPTGDVINKEGTMDMSTADPFLTSPNVRWHIVIDGKEYVINGGDTSSADGQTKLKKASKIKVITPNGEVILK